MTKQGARGFQFNCRFLVAWLCSRYRPSYLPCGDFRHPRVCTKEIRVVDAPSLILSLAPTDGWFPCIIWIHTNNQRLLYRYPNHLAPHFNSRVYGSREPAATYLHFALVRSSQSWHSTLIVRYKPGRVIRTYASPSGPRHQWQFPPPATPNCR